jgi:hypothetical protein
MVRVTCNIQFTRSDQIKDYEIGVCWFSAKSAVLKRKSKS